MSMFDRVISLWKSEDLLSQAWEESFEMMVLSNEMFSAAIRYLRRGEKIKTLKNLKKRDREINCLLYTSPSPRDLSTSRMPSSA